MSVHVHTVIPSSDVALSVFLTIEVTPPTTPNPRPYK